MTTKVIRARSFFYRVLAGFLVLFLVLIAAPVLGTSGPEDSLVLVGVGASGTWVTEITVSNAAAFPVNWSLNVRPGYLDCPIVCPGWVRGELPVAGTQTVLGGAGGVVFTQYMNAESSPPSALTVRARVVNTSRPTQAVELPVFRTSTIVALNPRVLVFPGAKRDAATRTNLVLHSIIRNGQGNDVTLALEAYSLDGRLLGSDVVVMRYGETRFLVDVLAQLGVASLDLGQIRVTKVAGDGVFWGTLFTTTTDGGVSVSVGAHP